MDDKIYVKYGCLDGTVRTRGRFQWDRGIQINITGLPDNVAAYMEFANEHMTESIRPETTADGYGTVSCMIPDSLFMMPYPVICYVIISDSDSMVTTMSVVIPVIARSKPSDYICTPDEVIRFSDLLTKMTLSIQEVNKLKHTVEAAIDDADLATQCANTAANKINSMTVDAKTLPHGTKASVTKTETNGRIQLLFGIPKGDTGDTNGVLYGAIQSLTDAQKETARNNIDSASVGDMAALKDEIDYLHPLSITSFSVTPNLVENGSTLSSETFAFAVNRLGAVLTLEDQTVSGGSASRSDTLTSDKTYTLKAVLNGVTKTATASIKFVAPVYYGVSSSYTLESNTVLALTKVLTTSRSRTFTVNAASGQYILYALPVSLGTPIFKVGGFEGGFTLAGEFDFTNSSGHTERYNLYRTVNAGLGNTTVNAT